MGRKLDHLSHWRRGAHVQGAKKQTKIEMERVTANVEPLHGSSEVERRVEELIFCSHVRHPLSFELLKEPFVPEETIRSQTTEKQTLDAMTNRSRPSTHSQASLLSLPALKSASNTDGVWFQKKNFLRKR